MALEAKEICMKYYMKLPWKCWNFSSIIKLRNQVKRRHWPQRWVPSLPPFGSPIGIFLSIHRSEFRRRIHPSFSHARKGRKESQDAMRSHSLPLKLTSPPQRCTTPGIRPLIWQGEKIRLRRGRKGREGREDERERENMRFLCQLDKMKCHDKIKKLNGRTTAKRRKREEKKTFQKWRDGERLVHRFTVTVGRQPLAHKSSSAVGTGVMGNTWT